MFLTSYFFWMLLTIIFLFVIFVKRKLIFWKNKGIPQLNTKFLIGNSRPHLPFGEHFRQLYNQFKFQNARHGGVYFFLRPLYMPLDPEIIKTILIKKFDHFTDRGLFKVTEKIDPLSANLFNLDGEKWRALRTKLSPTFTAAKMKIMFETMVECISGLEEFTEECVNSNKPINIKDILARFTTDIIGSCAFGLECNTIKTPDSEFRKYLSKVLEPNFFTQVRRLAVLLLPKELLILFRIKVIDDDVLKFFMDLVKETVEYREKNNVYRKDFMHLLLQIKNRGDLYDDKKIIDDTGIKKSLLNMDEISAQCFVFFVAGFDTSAITMTFALYELSENQHVQKTLRREIKEVLARHNGKFTYESIGEMNYLERVIKETLRKYPPVAGISRKCTKQFQIPGTEIVLEEGTHIHIPSLAIHMDPDYYPDPEKFDPERFTRENDEKRPGCTWLPFGEGPRNCIGMRFGMMQSKVGIAAILNKYKVTLNEKTRIPLVIDPTTPITTAKGGIWLNIENVY